MSKLVHNSIKKESAEVVISFHTISDKGLIANEFAISRRIAKNGTSQYFKIFDKEKRECRLLDIVSLLKGFDLDLKFYERYIFEQHRTVEMSQKTGIQLLEYVESVIGNDFFKEEMAISERKYHKILKESSSINEAISLYHKKKDALEENYQNYLGASALHDELESHLLTLNRMKNTYKIMKARSIEQLITTISADLENTKLLLLSTEESKENLEQELDNIHHNQNLLTNEQRSIKRDIQSFTMDLAKIEAKVHECEKSKSDLLSIEKKEESLLNKIKELEHDIIDLKTIDGLLEEEQLLKQELCRKNEDALKHFESLILSTFSMQSDSETRSLAHLEEKMKSIQASEGECDTNILSNGHAVEYLQKDITSTERSIDSVKYDLKSLDQKIITSHSTLCNLEKKISELNSIDKFPIEIDSQYSNRYLEAIRFLKKDHPTILGFLCELAYVTDQKYIQPINSVIGAGNLMKSIVVRDRKVANIVLQHFEQFKIGEVTCLILEELENISKLNKHNSASLLSILHTKSPQIDCVFYKLLGQWILVKDKDQAAKKLLGAKSSNIVTLRGEKFMASGEISATPTSYNWSMYLGLSTSYQAINRSLEDKGLENTKEETASLEAQLLDLNENISSLKDSRQGCLSNIEILEQKLHKLNSEKDNHSKSISKSKEMKKKLSNTKSLLLKQIEERKVNNYEILKRIEENERVLEEIDRISQSEGQYSRFLELKRSIFQLNSASKKHEDENESIKKEIEKLYKKVQLLAVKKKKLSTLISLHPEHLESSERLDSNLLLLKQKEVDLKNLIRANQKNIKKIIQKSASLSSILDRERKKMSALETSIKTNELKLYKLQTSIQEDLDIYEFKDSRKSLMKSEIEEHQFIVDRLNEDYIKAKEAIDEDKIQEYLSLKESIENCDKELNKLSIEIVECKNSISSLEEQRYAKLVESIELINQSLASIYRKLSIHGDCYISYSKEIAGLFELGITFNVKPDRYQWKTISELSGGQKSLASLALALSINQVFPCPILLIDEADASLDSDAVARLGQVIRNMVIENQKPPQFFIISHRPEFYEKFDHIIGIYRFRESSSMVVLEKRNNLLL